MPKGYYIRSDKEKKRLSQLTKGYKHSDETKKKWSEITKGENNGFYGKKHSNKTKLNMSEIKIGKKHSEESKIKMSIVQKGKIKSEIHKKRIQNSNIGKHNGKRTDECKLKMSKSRIKYLQNNKLSFKNTKPELETKAILNKYGIKFEMQKRINSNNGIKYYDFYLPDYNLLIEVDGIFYHGKNIKDEDLKYDIQKQCRKNDKYKNKLALEKGFTLLRVWQDELNKLDEYCQTILYYNNYKLVA